MSRHLKKEEFAKIYEEYQKSGFPGAFRAIYQISPGTKNLQRNSVKVRINKIIKYYNLGMEDLLQTKKGENRKKGSGSPKKKREPNWDIFDRDDLLQIAKRYYEITNELPKSKKIIESKSFSISYVKLSEVFGISRQTISKTHKIKISQKLPKHSDVIEKSFIETKSRYGRLKLSVYISQKYKIDINERSLGRYMNLLGLKCKLRQKSKRKEIKNVSSQIDNFVNRDYNDQNNRNIYATDVSYIKAPKDVLESHVYLSAILSHKTKQIVGFKLSRSNNLELVLDTLNSLKQYKPKNFIIHSDHGFQYTHHQYIKEVQNIGGVISLSRVGNSLDNREIEYWFGIIKTELLNDLDYSKITFNELNDMIQEYVVWYNNDRIQSNLNWKTPKQFAMAL